MQDNGTANHWLLCKMRNLFLIACIAFPFLLKAQASADTLIWSSKKLMWNNFKANADTATINKKHHATTLWKLRYQYKPLRSQTLLIEIEAWFDARKSWIKKAYRNDQNLLQHEQGHFDLAELLARRFRQKLQQQHLTGGNYNTVIANTFKTLLAEAYRQQEQYDKETNFGENMPAQQQWQQRIAAALNQLAAYASTSLVLPLH